MAVTGKGQYLRTNYRLTGGKVDVGALDSLLVVDSFYDSFSDFVTVSMGGYGKPKFLAVIGISCASGADASIPVWALPTQSFSGSIGWIYIYQSNEVMTGTARVLFMALIGSR